MFWYVVLDMDKDIIRFEKENFLRRSNINYSIGTGIGALEGWDTAYFNCMLTMFDKSANIVLF